MRILWCTFGIWLSMVNLAHADDKTFRLLVPDTLEKTGLPDHLLPRFSLKTSVKVSRVTSGEPAELELNTDNRGTAVFEGPAATWYLDVVQSTPAADRFVEWLVSDAGGRAITGYQPDDGAMFTLPVIAEVEEAPVIRDGDAIAGERLSLVHCGRCHVVNEKNRMKAIGSTPSFALIRALDNWEFRFEAFYALKPHPAFTQVDGITQPFDPARPSPIEPMRMSGQDLDAILAYVVTIEPADLGAPLQTQ